MKIFLQYVSDAGGNTKAVQLSLGEWKKVLLKLKKYEQALKLKTDLTEAYKQVSVLQKKKESKQTLKDFLNEL